MVKRYCDPVDCVKSNEPRAVGARIIASCMKRDFTRWKVNPK